MKSTVIALLIAGAWAVTSCAQPAPQAPAQPASPQMLITTPPAAGVAFAPAHWDFGTQGQWAWDPATRTWLWVIVTPPPVYRYYYSPYPYPYHRWRGHPAPSGRWTFTPNPDLEKRLLGTFWTVPGKQEEPEPKMVLPFPYSGTPPPPKQVIIRPPSPPAETQPQNPPPASAQPKE